MNRQSLQCLRATWCHTTVRTGRQQGQFSVSALHKAQPGTDRFLIRRPRQLHTSSCRPAQKKPKASKVPTAAPKAYAEYQPTSKQPVKPTQKRAPKTAGQIWRERKVPIIFGGSVLFTIAVWVGGLVQNYRNSGSAFAPSSPAEQEDISPRYNEIALGFDEAIDASEYMMGIKKWRRQMAEQASGDVCEVSIGTGRNLDYYDWDFKGYNGVGKIGSDNKVKRGKITSFTGVDQSWQMLKVAKQKFDKEFYGYEKCPVEWAVQDASKPLPPPPGKEPGQKYDTIIQTMGLCSASDPVALLKNLGNSVKEDTGRILLIEHGRSKWKWVNYVLDRGAFEHASQYGCWWNRDIQSIVEESGLEVVEMKSKLLDLGTTYWIELKPKSK